MAKDNKHESQSTKPTEVTGNTPAEQNTAAPKKHRKKGIKYTTVVESNFNQDVYGKTENPLDDVITLERGGLRFPGLIFESNLLGSLVKIPAKATAIKAPTLRQLVKVLDELYATK